MGAIEFGSGESTQIDEKVISKAISNLVYGIEGHGDLNFDVYGYLFNIKELIIKEIKTSCKTGELEEVKKICTLVLRNLKREHPIIDISRDSASQATDDFISRHMKRNLTPIQKNDLGEILIQLTSGTFPGVSILNSKDRYNRDGWLYCNDDSSTITFRLNNRFSPTSRDPWAVSIVSHEEDISFAFSIYNLKNSFTGERGGLINVMYAIDNIIYTDDLSKYVPERYIDILLGK